MKMVECVEVAGFMLPSEFLTDDDFRIDKENLIKSINDSTSDSSVNENETGSSENLKKSSGPTDQTDFMDPPRSFPQVPKPSVFQNTRLQQGHDVMKQHHQGYYQYKKINKSGDVKMVPWAIQKNLPRVGPFQRNVLFGGYGDLKRECAGTGVFLPRNYGNVDTSSHVLTTPRKDAIYQQEPKTIVRSSQTDMYLTTVNN